MDSEVVGDRIRKLMEENNITIEELANKMKLEEEVVKNKLNGKEEFYIEEMYKIKKLFGLDLDSVDKLYFQKNA